MIERCFSRGLRAYEFLGDADDYKLRWTDSCHELNRVQAFAPGIRGCVDRGIQFYGRRAARRLLQRDGRSAGSG
jgi:hypothetical protein